MLHNSKNIKIMSKVIIVLLTIAMPYRYDTKILLPDTNIMKDSHWLTFLSNFVKRYQDFTIIFHGYSSEKYDINDMVQDLNSKNEKNMTYFNILLYDYNHNKCIQKFERPNVFKVIHLLFDINENLTNILAQPTQILSNDVVIFFSQDDVRDNILKYGGNFLKIAGKTLLIQSKNTTIDIYKICYYCGQKSKKFHLLQSTEEVNIQINNSEIFPSKFLDLNGHLFNMAFIPYFPIITCEKNQTNKYVKKIKNLSNVQCTNIVGIEGNLLKLISRRHNFSYILNFMSPEAGWFNMVELINKSQLDIAVGGISMTIDRVPMVQFTKVFNFEEFNFLYLFDLTFINIFENFMTIFNAGLVWSLYFTYFIVLSFILYLALKIQMDEIYLKIKFDDTLWALLQIIIEQSNPYILRYYRHRASCGLILTCWWCCSLIFCTMYKSTVLSATAYPPNFEPQDLEGLLKAGYRLAGNQQTGDMIRDVLEGQDGIYKEARRKTIYGINTCDAFNKMLNGHVAMLDEQSTIQYEVRTVCKKPKDSQIQLLRMCRRAVRSTGHAWATQRGAPFTNAFNLHISRLVAAGLLKKWNEDTIQELKKNQIHFAREKNSGGVKALSLKRFLPLLTIYAVGITISTIVFLYELILSRWLCSYFIS